MDNEPQQERRFNSLSEAFIYFNDMNGKDPNNLDCIAATYELARVINAEKIEDSEILIIFNSSNELLHPDPSNLNYETEDNSIEDWRIHLAVRAKGMIIDPLFRTGRTKQDVNSYVKSLFPTSLNQGEISIFSMPTSNFEFLHAPRENYHEINSATSFIEQMQEAGLPSEGTKLSTISL